MKFKYGQNMAWGQSDFVQAMEMWFDEYKVMVLVMWLVLGL